MLERGGRGILLQGAWDFAGCGPGLLVPGDGRGLCLILINVPPGRMCLFSCCRGRKGSGREGCAPAKSLIHCRATVHWRLQRGPVGSGEEGCLSALPRGLVAWERPASGSGASRTLPFPGRRSRLPARVGAHEPGLPARTLPAPAAAAAATPAKRAPYARPRVCSGPKKAP
jgi:hypothetical protein